MATAMSTGMQFFVLRVASNKEDRVREALMRKVKIEGLEALMTSVAVRHAGEAPDRAAYERFAAAAAAATCGERSRIVENWKRPGKPAPGPMETSFLSALKARLAAVDSS
jgi:hypothetical protein